jgi:Arc-like DNA binding dprotein
MAENDRRAVYLRRVPEELYRQLRAEADASERTVPAEILHRLRASLRKPEEAAA